MSTSPTKLKLENGLLITFIGWMVPGAGHIYLGYAMRGIILGMPVWVLFFFGIMLGGHLHSFNDSNESLLTYVFGLCDIGTGLLYFLAKSAGLSHLEQGGRLTSEYANIFFMVAGLLNYLLALDALDICSGKKS